MISEHKYPTVTVKDGDGNIIFEGIARSYSLMRDYYGYEFKVEGTMLRKVHNDSKLEPKFINVSSGNISASDLSKGIVLNTCNHQWRHYPGLMKSYDFCELCSEKRNES